MRNKILITCPPMLKQINNYRDLFSSLDYEITTPKVIQTLSEDELIKVLPEHDGWIIGDDLASAKVFKSGKNGKLRAAVKWGIGVDNVDFNACKELNIPIKNTPNMFGSEVSDLAMCYLLGLSRDAFYIDREVRRGNWIKPSGISLRDKVLGIVGLGDIGLNIAKRAHAHELEIIGWDPSPKDLPKYINYSKVWPESLEKCDFLVFACALTEDNYHMLNVNNLKKLKNGVRVINISRGGLICEKALFKGLKDKIIHSVALDVFEEEPVNIDNPLLKEERCIFGSHNASNTIDAVDRASHEAIKIIHEMLEKS